ncbi:hypothetical protein T484DRAFT_3640011, partial [Baffinella frigidus]
ASLTRRLPTADHPQHSARPPALAKPRLTARQRLPSLAKHGQGASARNARHLSGWADRQRSVVSPPVSRRPVHRDATRRFVPHSHLLLPLHRSCRPSEKASLLGQRPPRARTQERVLPHRVRACVPLLPHNAKPRPPHPPRAHHPPRRVGRGARRSHAHPGLHGAPAQAVLLRRRRQRRRARDQDPRLHALRVRAPAPHLVRRDPSWRGVPYRTPPLPHRLDRLPDLPRGIADIARHRRDLLRMGRAAAPQAPRLPLLPHQLHRLGRIHELPAVAPVVAHVLPDRAPRVHPVLPPRLGRIRLRGQQLRLAPLLPLRPPAGLWPESEPENDEHLL